MNTRTHLDADLAADPILIPHQGRLAWLFPSGAIVPDISGAEGDDEKKHSDADLNRIIQQRLEQWQRNNPTKPDDYDQIKTELAQLKSANGSTLDQANTKIATLENEIKTKDAAIAAANGERDAAKLNLLGLAMKSAVTTAARSAANPDQVYALLPKDALTIGDDGQVKGADEAVKKFLTENPHFVGKAGLTPDRGQGQQGNAPTGRDAGIAEAQKRFGPKAGATQQ